MKQLFDDPAELADAKVGQAGRRFLSSLTSNKEARMTTTTANEPPAPEAAELTPEPEPDTPAESETITLGEVAGMIGVALNELTMWAERGLLPTAEQHAGHPHRWTWRRDVMKRWAKSMQGNLSKARRSRLA